MAWFNARVPRWVVCSKGKALILNNYCLVAPEKTEYIVVARRAHVPPELLILPGYPPRIPSPSP